MTNRIVILVMGAIWASSLTMAFAQEAPTPHKLPRLPVSQQILPSHKEAVLVSRDVNGQPTVLDGETLQIGNIALRLFGIVPPQLSANYGPQARASLDMLTAGNALHCQIRDRDHEGHFLATCRTSNNLDPALELLKRGLAVAARGSLAGTDMAAPYAAAEQGAQIEKIGLWSGNSPSPATPSSSAGMAQVAQSAPVVLPPVSPPPAPVELAKGPDKSAQRPMIDEDKTTSSSVVSKEAKLKNQDNYADHNMGFFAKYQILLTGLVMLITALSICGVLVMQRRTERRDEMKAIAAALRGELMAARALCQGRLKSIMTEADDKAMSWPRIRSTLYQAYVGRIGWLGAELARQVVSLYGQSSDYAAYYQTGEETYGGSMPKRHALHTLVQHIEEVLPKLALIEQTGKRLEVKGALAPALRAPSHPIPLESIPLPVASLAAPAKSKAPSTDRISSTGVSFTETSTTQISTTEASTVDTSSTATSSTEALSAESSFTENIQSSKKETLLSEPAKTALSEMRMEKTTTKISLSENVVPSMIAPSAASSSRTVSSATISSTISSSSTSIPKARSKDPIEEALANLARLSPPRDSVEKSSSPSSHQTKEIKPSDPEVSSVPLWSAVRKFAREHLPEKSAASSEPKSSDEDFPDYASLIEEDMSHYSFEESDEELEPDSLHESIGHLGQKSRNGSV